MNLNVNWKIYVIGFLLGFISTTLLLKGGTTVLLAAIVPFVDFAIGLVIGRHITLKVMQ